MSRFNLFKHMLDQMDSNYPPVKEDYKYVGTGNPDSKILIVGKETSIHNNNDQIKWEITDNFKDWRKISSNNTTRVEKWNGANYSPSYPYKGQIFKIEPKNSVNGGTSHTWYNYQKLYNLIFDKAHNDNIDFHEGVFITEVNSSPSLKTKDADTKSIEFRKKILLKSKFFQSFPIVIISGLGYFEVDKTRNEIEEIFGVKFIRKESALNKKSQTYWIHEGVSHPKKLLINTRQLSIGVSDALLWAIANEIKESGLIYN